MMRLLSVVVVFGSCACGTVGIAQSQPAPQATAGRPFSLPLDPEKFVGILKCADCHNAPSPLRSTDWVKLTELDQWRTKDKHSEAFNQLSSPRGQQIGKVLWGDAASVTGRQECLSCHANWVRGAPLPKPINLKEGVACESCHGPGADYLAPHEEVAWRTKSNDEKRALGMVNVRDPRERARQCLSCHIGNAEEGKVLTHEMYAAGHPPLPGIEIETFAQHMPPHWRTLNQKVADLARLPTPKQLPDLEKLRSAEVLNQPAGELHGVKSVLVGGVMVLRESIDLTGRLVATQGESGPEFALFDCAMCHHNLQTPSWRQTRMLSGRLTPGRPQLPQWPAALIEVAMSHAARGNTAELAELRTQLASHRGKLQTPFNKSPFGLGRSEEVATASDALVAWLDALVHRVAAASYDRAACESVLKDLCRQAQESEPMDYDSARQLAWAIRTIARQIDPPPGDRVAQAHALQELSNDLRLDLPWGKQDSILDPAAQQKAFQAASGYDPRRFQQQVARLLTALGPVGTALP
jgi:hypothetical protein